MQAIVADTTPLNYLVLIQAADILPNLYRTVLMPPAVKTELAHANTPAVVRAWISQPSPWLEVVSLKLPVDSALANLDAGELEAISLASELQATLLLMDERDGVTIARHRGDSSWQATPKKEPVFLWALCSGTWPLANQRKTLSRNFPISRATKSLHVWTMPANWPNLRPSSDGPAVPGREFESRRPRHSQSSTYACGSIFAW